MDAYKTPARALAAEFGWKPAEVYTWIRKGLMPARWSWRKFDYLVDEAIANNLRDFERRLAQRSRAN